MTLDAGVINWVLTGIGGIFMFLWKRGLDQQSKELEGIQEAIQSLKDTRLHKDDFKDFKMELRTQFQDLKEAIKGLTSHAS